LYLIQGNSLDEFWEDWIDVEFENLHRPVNPVKNSDSNSKVEECSSHADRLKEQQEIPSRPVEAANVTSSVVKVNTVPFIHAPLSSRPSRDRLASNLWRRTAIIAALLPNFRILRSSCDDAPDSPNDVLPDLPALMPDGGRTPPNPAARPTPDLSLSPASPAAFRFPAAAGTEASSLAASRRGERGGRDGAAWQSALRLGVETLAALAVVDRGADGSRGEE
jgi:hypothetical protein